MLGSPHTPGASRDLAGLPGSGSQTSIVLNALPFAASARIGVATFCASVAVSAFGDRACAQPAAGGAPLPMAANALGVSHADEYAVRTFFRKVEQKIEKCHQ